jgi:Tfp pilus assembly protein PilF
MKIKGRKQKKELAAAIDRSRRLLMAGQNKANFELLERAVKQFPDDPEIRLLYATILLEFRPDEVASQASRAVDLASDNPRILVRAAHLLFSRGEVEAARLCADRANDLAQPGFVLMADLVNLNGLLAMCDEEYGLAEERLRAAVESQPDNGSFAVDLARFLATRDRHAEANEVLDQISARTNETDTLERVRSEISRGVDPER